MDLEYKQEESYINIMANEVVSFSSLVKNYEITIGIS